MEPIMLNKITALVFIKSEVEKHTTEKGNTYYKIFCTSKAPSGDGYIPYNFKLWGSRFDAISQLLKKDKPIYIEADLQEPKPYMNSKGEPTVVLHGYVTKIELLPREKMVEEKEDELLEQEIPF